MEHRTHQPSALRRQPRRTRMIADCPRPVRYYTGDQLAAQLDASFDVIYQAGQLHGAETARREMSDQLREMCDQLGIGDPDPDDDLAAVAAATGVLIDGDRLADEIDAWLRGEDDQPAG